MPQEQKTKSRRPNREEFANRKRQELDQAWADLQEAIQSAHVLQTLRLSFQDLYRKAYMMVICKEGEKLYNGLVDITRGHLQGIVTQLTAKLDVQFLQELEMRWKKYCRSMQIIRDFCMYLDRIYLKNTRKTGLPQLTLELWRDVVVRDPIIDASLRAQRFGQHGEKAAESQDQQLQDAVCKMLKDLGDNVYEALVAHPTPQAHATNNAA